MTWDLMIYTVVALGVLLLVAGPSKRRRRPAEGPWVRASRRTTYEMSYTHGYQAGYCTGQAESRLPPALWQHMLVLVHPDHHEGSPLQPMAAEVTRWLLRHRAKAGAERHG
jgi:hypothetical protein